MGTTETALAVTQPAGVAALDAALGQWSAMQAMAASIAKSGMMPRALSTPEAVLAVMLTGRELGMGPMEAARSLHLVEGRVVMTADAQLARAIRAGVAVQWEVSTDTEARVRLSRGGTHYVSAYTIAMAQRAGLAGRGTWKAHTEAMLRARAVTAGIRAYCPDVLGGGVYSPDEAEDIRQPAAPVAEVAAEVVATVVAAPSRHHPTWERDRARFCAVLGELGLRYEDLADYTAAHGQTGQRPSAMTTQGRDKLLDGLRAGGAAKVAAWVAERAVATEAREPGEEG